MPFNPVTNIYTRLSNSFSHPVNGTVISEVDAENYFDDIDTAFNLSFSTLPRNVIDFGADPTGAADSTAAFQAAVDSMTNGGELLIPGEDTFRIDGSVIIRNPICIRSTTLRGPNSNNITAGTLTNNVFVIRSSHVIIEKLQIGRSAAGTTGCGITIGDNTRVITDAAINNGSFTFNSPAQAAFTPADVGGSVVCGAAGLLFSPIVAYVSPTQVTLGVAATATVAGASAQFGPIYSHVFIRDVRLAFHKIGVLMAAAGGVVLDNVIAYCHTCVSQNDRLYGDVGDNTITNCELTSYDAADGSCVLIRSGGGLKITGGKMISGFAGVWMSWDGPSTSLGPYVVGVSIEGNGYGVFIQCSTFDVGGSTWAGCEIGVGGVPFFVDPASTHYHYDFVVSGNLLRSNGGDAAISIGKGQKFTISDNQITTDGVGTGVTLAAASQNGVVRLGSMDSPTHYSDSGTNNAIYANVWSAYTPSLASGTGTFTTAGATGRYLMRGRTVQVEIIVTITTNGTAATSVIVGLPFTVKAADSALLNGRETTIGKALQGYGAPSASTAIVVNYDNTYPGANGNVLKVTGSYEIA